MHEITVKELTKTYKRTTALDNVSLHIQGSYGLLGPNGAGKTTLMRILATIIEPDKGYITYNGLSWSQKNDVRQKIGYLPQHFSAYKQLNVVECLDHFAVLKGINNKQDRKNQVTEVLEKVNLTDKGDMKIKSLSGGMQRRLGIAQALLGEPEILIVDEPTAGLDVQERARFRSVLKKISENRIIIISTHIVEDLEAVCTHIGIINNGQVVQEDKLQHIKKKANGKIWRMPLKYAEEVRDEDIISTITENDDHFIRFISEEGLQHAEPITPSLEDAYLYLIRDEEY